MQKLLKKLQLSDTGTVYFFEEKSKWQSIVSSEVFKKLCKIKPDAFYLFNNQPYILFYDLTTHSLQEEREIQIHKQSWSFDQSPLVFILKEKDLEIFNALAYSKTTKKLEQIKLGEDESVEQVFSFWQLQSGDTWRWLQEKHYNKNIHKKRVYQKLFENIKAVREALTNETHPQSIDEDEANILILRLIFIRYLIDRGVKLDANYISGKTLLERRKSFSDLIRQPKKLNRFFEWLNSKFNGVLFKDIKIILSTNIAKELAQIFKGELPQDGSLFEGTDYYFEIFDFSIIPVELISGIYESLIDVKTRKLHSAVYTPSFLVEYILTHTVDAFFDKKKNKDKTECKVFDPSVGSGIFLVQAFRRMADKELELKGRVTRTRLREIVYNNLFGIDINEQALKVTCFSIYVAMLDYFEPSSILPQFEFPNLIGSNLFKADFFNTDHDFNKIIGEKTLDFILGNPPWKSDKDDVHLKWINQQNKTVGNFEIAQSFLLRTKDFMSISTESSLIVSSTIFYNISKTTKKFKQDFLSQFCINRFFDLSPVRKLIFKEKKSPCTIVFYQKASDKDYLKHVVKHLSVKSNIFLKYYKTLIIEKFDQKEILQRHFLENDWMFKVALYGNTLDFSFLMRINTHRSIEKYFGNRLKPLDGFKRDKLASFKLGDIDSFITEKENITPYYTVPNEKLQKNLSLQPIYSKFGDFKIILKGQTKNESEIVISYTEGKSIFRNDTFLFITKETCTKYLYAYLISNLYTYFQYITSSTWGIATRPAIRLKEYLNFPFAEASTTDTQNQIINLVNDFLAPLYTHYKEKLKFTFPPVGYEILDKINDKINELYEIRDFEKDLIKYVLDVSRYQFQENKYSKVTRKIHNDDNVLREYADVFIQEFSSIYKDEYMQVTVYPLQHFIAMNFEFCVDKPQQRVTICTDQTEESEILYLIASNLTISSVSKELYIQKDIKGFEDNSFYIIKPNEYKCWHRALAWYDVAEFKKTIEESEIDYLNTHLDG